MDARNFVAAIRLIERARRKPATADYLRGRAAEISGVPLRDLDRALDVATMAPEEFFRHEMNVARILSAIDAPVRVRLIQMQRQPVINPGAGRPDCEGELENLKRPA